MGDSTEESQCKVNADQSIKILVQPGVAFVTLLQKSVIHILNEQYHSQQPHETEQFTSAATAKPRNLHVSSSKHVMLML